MSRLNSRFVLLAIILLGAFLRFLWIGEKSLWLDEAFTLWVAKHSLTDVWLWIARIDQHPPLFYLLLSLWVKLFGESEVALRSLPALLGTATLPLIYAITRQVSSQRAVALLATLLLAVSTFHIHFAQETRMYTLLALSATGALYFALRITNGASSWRIIVGLALCQAVALWTHNTAVIFLPAAVIIGSWRLGTGDWKPKIFKRHTSDSTIRNSQFAIRNSQFLACALWLPWASNFVQQARKVDQEFWIGPPGLLQVFDVFQRLLIDHSPSSVTAFVWVVVVIAVVIVGTLRLRKEQRTTGLLLAFWLVPLLGELLVSLRRPILHPPSLIWTSIPLYVLLACGFHALFAQRWASRFRRLGGLAVGLATAIIVSASLGNYYVTYQKEAWRAVAEAVSSQSRDGDLILFNATWVQLPFEYYFRQSAASADLHGIPVDLFERGVTEPKMTSADLPRLRQLLNDQAHVWLVYSHDWYTDPQQLTLGELNAQLTLEQSLEFQGVRVFEYVRK